MAGHHAFRNLGATQKAFHVISSPSHLKALEHLEATIMAADLWLKPALSMTPCTKQWNDFLQVLANAKRFLLDGAVYK